jgi:hypothetical protein
MHFFTAPQLARSAAETVPTPAPRRPETYPVFPQSRDTAALRPAEKDTSGPAPATHATPPEAFFAFDWQQTELPDRALDRSPNRRSLPSSASAAVFSAPDYARRETTTLVDSASTSHAVNAGTTPGMFPERFPRNPARITRSPADSAIAVRASGRSDPPPPALTQTGAPSPPPPERHSTPPEHPPYPYIPPRHGLFTSYRETLNNRP